MGCEQRGGAASVGGGLSEGAARGVPKRISRATLLLLLSPLLLWTLYLLFLPLFPSQDGPTHLMSGGMLFDCLADREPASSYYFWRSGKLTNQLCTLGLGLLQEVGMSPRLAEGTWHVLLLALLVLTWKRMLPRIQGAPSSVLLLLLPFMGQVLHMGFYNFLAGVHLGLLAWTYRKPGWINPASDILFLLALYAHPLGAACYIALCVMDGRMERRWRHIPTLLPHALLFLWISSGNTGGKLGRAPFASPDFLGRTWSPLKEDVWIFLSVPLLVVLVAGLRAGWSRLSPASRSRRQQLLLFASLPLLASGFFPDIFGAATHLRIRAAYLAWVLLLLALAPVPGCEGRLLLGLRQGLILALVALNFGADRSMAQELQAFLDRMPRPAKGATVLAGYDLYQAEIWPLQERLLPEEPVVYRHNSILDLQRRLHFNPWHHIMDRWAHEAGALSLNNHQALYAHSPLGHRNPPSVSWREGLDYKCSQLPVDELQGAADLILFAHLESAWLESAGSRLPKGLSIMDQGRDWLLFAGGGDPSSVARMSRPFFSQELTRWPVPCPITPETSMKTRVRVMEPFSSLNAWYPFRAFVLDFESMTFRQARKEEIWPREGIYDGEGAFLFEKLERPGIGQLFLLPR